MKLFALLVSAFLLIGIGSSMRGIQPMPSHGYIQYVLQNCHLGALLCSFELPSAPVPDEEDGGD